MISKYLTIIGLFVLICGCERRPVPPVLKIAVYSDGLVTVDGSKSSIESLRKSLAALVEKHGVVWYYREAGRTEAPPIAKEVIHAVMDHKLPIRLSSKADYSDAIGTGGEAMADDDAWRP